MDFQKAFDKVHHKRLIAKLKHYGISLGLIKWIFTSYLDNRRQYVSINQSSSALHPVLSDIPQGTVLGPLLFVIYINDLTNDLNSEVFMFADDTKIFRTITSPTEETHLQNDLNSLMKWSSTWLMPFNSSKCKYMHINTRTPTPANYTLQQEGTHTTLPLISEENDLGVIFDSTLEFEDHINSKVSKATRNAGLIRRTFDYLDNNTFTSLYKALVRSQLEYASSVWFPYK